MTSTQCRMARAGLNWSGSKLSEVTGIRPATISAFEKGGAALTTTVDRLRQAFKDTGRVRFEGDCGVFVDAE